MTYFIDDSGTFFCTSSTMIKRAVKWSFIDETMRTAEIKKMPFSWDLVSDHHPKNFTSEIFKKIKKFFNSTAVIVAAIAVAQRASSIFTPADVSTKAILHCSATYKNAGHAQWSASRDGFMTFFSDQGIVSRIFYDKKGKWRFGISYYGEARSPKNNGTGKVCLL